MSIYINDESDFYLNFDFEEGIIIDLRSQRDWLLSRIPNSLNIDLNTQDFLDHFDQLDKRQFLLLYCTNGTRSALAIEVLQEKGFTNLFQLTNGIKSWNGKLLYS